MAYSDQEAWFEYPHYRHWFNKLELSLRLGYDCGPCGTAPSVTGPYVVRPIYNLEGMGVGAIKMIINAGDARQVPPGFFWCEWFTGLQHSITYEWDVRWDEWVPTSSWLGVNDPNNLSRFQKWVRSDWTAPLPYMFNELDDCDTINVEFIGDKIIEVHLRPSPDPDWTTEIIPVWADQEVPEDMVEAYDDAGGFLQVPRLGFIIR